MITDARQQALDEIASLARAHRLTAKDIGKALTEKSAAFEGNKTTLFFASIGAIFIFSGIAAFISMFWEEMGSPARVILTLGSGFSLFVIGLLAANDKRYLKASSPLLLIAAFLQPTGLFVLLHEYFPPSNDLRTAAIFVSGVMLFQQLLCWFAVKRPLFLFCALVFGSAFFSVTFDMLYINDKWNSIIMGISVSNIAYALARLRTH